MTGTACDQADHTKSAPGDTSRNSIDWEGYYYGVGPCQNCPGTETWLRLNGPEDTAYELIERKQGELTARRSSGKIAWEANQSNARLVTQGEERMIFVGEGFVEIIGADQKNATRNPAFALAHQQAFAGSGRQLLVKSDALKQSSTGLQFDVLVNFEHRTEGDYKSMRARAAITCGKNTYSLSDPKYFAGHFATDREIKAPAPAPSIPFEGKDDVFGQLAKQVCEG